MSWWRNGRRRGLKILIPRRGVWVRIPPRIQNDYNPLMSDEFKKTQDILHQHTEYFKALHLKADQLLKELQNQNEHRRLPFPPPSPE